MEIIFFETLTSSLKKIPTNFLLLFYNFYFNSSLFISLSFYSILQTFENDRDLEINIEEQNKKKNRIKKNQKVINK